MTTFFISSCCSYHYDQKDFEFNADELKYFSSFHIGDTIFYESSNFDLDTILILNYDTEKYENCGGLMAPRPLNGKWVRIKHLPIDKWHGTIKVQDKPIRINYQSLFLITKYPLDKRTEFSIDFKDFQSRKDTIIGEYHTDTIDLHHLEITNYYIVNHGYPDRITDSTNIECVYWTDKEGLIAYKNKGGQVWTKKSNR
ncbi:MAG: hypothetical protein R2852_09535 [Bacteroidia bacterium]